ncbi:hypothetical protein ACQKLP_10805 [Chitinophaga sp. NPDC101104]|uniref:tetratricopeptide repeat protein n=1 Tax=Chitinophaga sp. NPDC101104 TaxID=3390561 RepID=UPI003D046B7F
MGNLIETGWDVAFNKFAPGLPAVKAVRDFITSKSFIIHQFFQEMGLGADAKDFTDIYYKALQKLEAHTHPDVVRVFRDKTIKSFFEDSFRGELSKKDFLQHIHAHLAVRPELLHFRLSIENDLDDLMVYFLQTIFESMDPATRYTVNQLHAVRSDVVEVRWRQELESELATERHSSLESKIDMLLSRLPAELSAGLEAHMSQEDFEDNIKPILEQLAKKRNRAAIDLLEAFRDRKAGKLTPAQNFKIGFALGQAYLELSESEKAAEVFITLPDVLPGNAEAFGVGAMGYAIKNNSIMARQYAEKGLKLSPGLPSAVVAGVMSLPVYATIEALDNILQNADLTNPMIALNTAEWLIAKGPSYYQRAMNILENSIAKDGTLACAEKLERMAILNAKIAIADYNAMGNVMTEESRQRLILAENWLTQARDYYKDTDLRRVKWAITANRGVIRKVLGNYEAAKTDLLVAFDEERNFFLYHHLLILDMELGKVNRSLIREAREQLQLTKEQDEDILMMELNGLLEDKNHQEIFRILDERKVDEADEEATCKLNFFRSLAMMQTGDLSGGFKLARDTADKYPNNPQIAHRTADLALMVGDGKAAHEYATRAIRALGPAPANNILFSVVELCFKLGHFQEVVDVLNQPRFRDRWNRYSEFLVSSLNEVGRKDDAIALVEKFYDPNNPIPFCVLVLIDEAEGAHDFVGALDMARNAIKHHPDDPMLRGKELAYFIRSRDETGKVKRLKDLESLQWSKDQRLQALFIGIVSAGHEHFLDGLNLALLIRNENIEDLSGHQGYVKFIAGLNNNGFRGIATLVVVPSCGVELEDGSGAIRKIFIDDNGVFLDSVSSNSEEALALTGGVLNAPVNIGGVQYRIKKILSLFEVALLDSQKRIKNAGIG